ncbi:chromosomal replication initiator protein DnaA [Thermodesulfobacteriota bacterium]
MPLWEKTKEILKDSFPANNYTLWIEPLQCVRADEKEIELAGPDRFFNTWVQDKYLGNIQESLEKAGSGGLQICFAVQSEGGGQQLLPATCQKEQLLLPEMTRARSNIRSLHPRYTFDEFMVGETNMLAHSACLAMANNDDTLGRCLFIEAGTGLGKSHLSHSVAHHIINNSPATRLHYKTAQQLTAEMVRGIRSNTMDQFKEKYHEQCDVLLIEDVHALAGRVKTQSELSEMMDILLETEKRIIFTSSVSPRDLPDIDPGFRSRMASGLITTINPPDLRTRRLIIKRKAANNNIDLADDLITYLAEQIKGDIRMLESAIVGIKAKSTLLRVAPDLDMVKEVVGNIVDRFQELSAEVIRDYIARQFKVSVTDMRSKTRKKEITFPRQVTMYLARKLTDQPLSDIGKALNRDHSTVVHSIKVISGSIVRNNSVRGQVELLSKKIKQQFL